MAERLIKKFNFFGYNMVQTTKDMLIDEKYAYLLVKYTQILCNTTT